MADPTVSTPARPGFVVHQLLHGYDDGHRLLASSLPLSRESIRKTGYLSDLSGPTLARGFEGYLTGYTFPDLPAYALAKTWPAPEMSRPGCVWTHTLILEEALVARVTSLDELTPLFARPANGKFKNYGHPLPYLPRHPPVVPSPLGPMRSALWKLFGPDPEPLLFEAADAREWEPLFFALWALGWPGLRMDLSFCTGLLSARNARDGLFDMQAAPPTVIREIVREIRTKHPGAGSPQADDDLPEWVSVAAHEARGGSALAAFFAEVADHDTDRTCFALLTEIYSLCSRGLDKPVASAELLALLARQFPAPDEGTRLKSLLLGSPSPAAVDELALLDELATTAHYACLASVDLHPHARGERLWKRDGDGARKVLLRLFRASLNPLGEQILRGLIHGLSVPDARKVAQTDPDLLIAAVRVRPALAADAALWDLFAGRRRYLFDALTGSPQDLTGEQVQRIVAALLEQGADELAPPAIQLFGRRAVAAALDWVQTHPAAPSAAWSKALAQHPDAVLDWFATHAGETDRVALLVGPALDHHSPEVIRHGTGVWQSAANKIDTLPDRDTRRRFEAFLLALALENPQPDPERLAGLSFFGVHEALEHSDLDYETWQVLERKLPDLGWMHSWDRCERLRRGLLEAFVRFHWPPAALARGVPRRPLLKSLRKSARKVPGAEELFRRVFDAIEADL